jgi:hypothetical protein
MRALRAILIVAAMVPAMTMPASAADLFTPALQSDASGLGFVCNAVNKSTTANITVKLEAIVPGTGSLASCPSVVVAAQRGTGCYVGGAGSRAYCKITTSSAGNTRGNVMVLDSGFTATSSADAK